MLGVKLICVGKLKEAYWRDAVAEYEKRLRPLWAKTLRTAACLLLISGLALGASITRLTGLSKNSPQAISIVVALWVRICTRLPGDKNCGGAKTEVTRIIKTKIISVPIRSQ